MLLGRLANMSLGDARSLPLDELEDWLNAAVRVDVEILRGRNG